MSVVLNGKFVSHVNQPEINAEKVSIHTAALGGQLASREVEFLNMSDLKSALDSEAAMSQDYESGPRM